MQRQFRFRIFRLICNNYWCLSHIGCDLHHSSCTQFRCAFVCEPWAIEKNETFEFGWAHSWNRRRCERWMRNKFDFRLLECTWQGERILSTFSVTVAVTVQLVCPDSTFAGLTCTQRHEWRAAAAAAVAIPRHFPYLGQKVIRSKSQAWILFVFLQPEAQCMFCVVADVVSLFSKNCWQNNLHPNKFPVDLETLESNALSVNTLRLSFVFSFVLISIFRLYSIREARKHSGWWKRRPRRKRLSFCIANRIKRWTIASNWLRRGHMMQCHSDGIEAKRKNREKRRSDEKREREIRKIYFMRCRRFSRWTYGAFTILNFPLALANGYCRRTHKMNSICVRMHCERLCSCFHVDGATWERLHRWLSHRSHNLCSIWNSISSLAPTLSMHP